MKVHPIYRVVLTGGPCGGKTTAVVFILERLASLGYKALIVPEMATQYILSGILREDLAPYQFQELILNGQRNQEIEFANAAQIYAKTQPTVIIYDRGMLDGAAFCNQKDWETATRLVGVKPTQIRDTNYDLVIHMVTAAEGAEESYSLANNKARRESADEARDADSRIQQAWIGHPRFRVIDNSTDFREKVNRVVAEICKTIGLPAPVEAKKKYLVLQESTDTTLKNIHCCKVEIEQIYLLSPECEERRLRKRTQNEHSVYFHTIKKDIGYGERVEEDSIISEDAFLALLSQKDPSRKKIRKYRYCMLYKQQYVEIDRYLNPKLEFDIVEIESSISNLPNELNILKEASQEQYSNDVLSRL